MVKDLDKYKIDMTVLDIDPFEKISKEEFIKETDRIKEDTATKNIDELLVELMKVNAELMDEHSEISGYGNVKVMPFVFSWFNEGLYIIKTEPDHNNCLYGKLIAINHIPIERVIEKITTLLPDKNEGYVKGQVTEALRLNRILHGLDIINRTDSVPLTLVEASNDTVNRMVAFKDENDIRFNKYGRSKAFLRLRNPAYYWYDYESDKNYLYFKYNACFQDSGYRFIDFVDDFFKVAKQKNPAKIIIDMRDNGGGERAQIKPFLIKLYASAFNRPGCIYVLIGRATFSAGMNNVFDIGRVLPVTTVGETTGGSINHLGQPEIFKLKNCGLTVRYS
ncbi:MAG TPA: hypothetical protein VK890_11700, partial [Bacteroidia bacterium]|nr:hypothetical protein [Bacteroidia bacterium]